MFGLNKLIGFSFGYEPTLSPVCSFTATAVDIQASISALSIFVLTGKVNSKHLEATCYTCVCRKVKAERGPPGEINHT